jgi:Type II/IV secretion system protein
VPFPDPIQPATGDETPASRPIDVAKMGKPWAKFVVPSSGSTCQVGMPPGQLLTRVRALVNTNARLPPAAAKEGHLLCHPPCCLGGVWAARPLTTQQCCVEMRHPMPIPPEISSAQPLSLSAQDGEQADSPADVPPAASGGAHPGNGDKAKAAKDNAQAQLRKLVEGLSADDTTRLVPCAPEGEWSAWQDVLCHETSYEPKEKEEKPTSFEFSYSRRRDDKKVRVQASSAFGRKAWSLTFRGELGTGKPKPGNLLGRGAWAPSDKSEVSELTNSERKAGELHLFSFREYTEQLYKALTASGDSEPKGLLLVTGRTGGGKTKIVHGLIHQILDGKLRKNPDRKPHLVTFEDPIEDPLYEECLGKMAVGQRESEERKMLEEWQRRSDLLKKSLEDWNRGLRERPGQEESASRPEQQLNELEKKRREELKEQCNELNKKWDELKGKCDRLKAPLNESHKDQGSELDARKEEQELVEGTEMRVAKRWLEDLTSWLDLQKEEKEGKGGWLKELASQLARPTAQEIPRKVVDGVDAGERIFARLVAAELVDYTPREAIKDCAALEKATKDALRQTPAVFYVGELREDSEIRAALEFAATGHLIVATAHAGSLVEAVTKILNSVEAKSPAERARWVPRIWGVIQLESFRHIADPSNRNWSATIPSLYRRTDTGVQSLVADGISALLPSRPSGKAPPDVHSLGFAYFVERLTCKDSGGLDPGDEPDPNNPKHLRRALCWVKEDEGKGKDEKTLKNAKAEKCLLRRALERDLGVK